MKKLNNFKNYLLLAVLLVFGLASCRKDTNGKFAGKGAPVISRIRTVSKSDTLPEATYTTYDSTGTASSVPAGYQVVTIAAFDSTTTTGRLSNLYAILGQNLGSTTKIVLNGVSIPFNRGLNSDNTVIFSIPQTLPTGPDQTNKIVLTTLYGTVTYAFTVISPPPTIIAVTDFDFYDGYTIKLLGTGFKTVTSVALTGSTATPAIESISGDTVITLKMPSTTLSRTNLIFTYGTGNTQTSPVEFVDLDNAYTIFYKNSFQNSWADGSWSGPSGVSTGASHSGTASAEATYPAGGWKIEGWANWYPGIDKDSYKYLTFWVKGGTVTHTLILVGDKVAGGYSQNTSAPAIQQIVVPPKVWTYFKIPLGTGGGELNYWATGTNANQLGFFLQGQSGDVDETYYFDEVAFVK